MEILSVFLPLLIALPFLIPIVWYYWKKDNISKEDESLDSKNNLQEPTGYHNYYGYYEKDWNGTLEKAKFDYAKAVKIYESLLSKFNYEKRNLSTYETVFLIEDILPVYVGVHEQEYTQDLSEGPYYSVLQNSGIIKGSLYYVLVEDFLKNTIFKFNGRKFKDNFENSYYDIKIRYFYGITEKHTLDSFNATKFFYVNEKFPELRLMQRYEEWEGVLYHFVILENGERRHIIKTKNANVNNFVHNLFTQNKPGEKFTYLLIDKYIKEECQIEQETQKILDDVNNGLYADIPRQIYTVPENKWKSEERVYECCKAIFGEEKVIYQYSPSFLGQMSYDIYIPYKKLAIEYQGKQHFEPVEFFGGQKHFEQQVKRDKLKKKLSEENGVTLVYINYDEDISNELIIKKIKDAGIGFRPKIRG